MKYNFVFAFTPSVPPPTHVGSFDVTTSTTHLLDKLCFLCKFGERPEFCSPQKPHVKKNKFCGFFTLRDPYPGKDGSRQIPVTPARRKVPGVSSRWARLHSVNSGEFNGAHASPENFSTCNPGGGIGCCVRARGTSPCMIRDGERNVQEHCASNVLARCVLVLSPLPLSSPNQFASIEVAVFAPGKVSRNTRRRTKHTRNQRFPLEKFSPQKRKTGSDHCRSLYAEGCRHQNPGRCR